MVFCFQSVFILFHYLLFHRIRLLHLLFFSSLLLEKCYPGSGEQHEKPSFVYTLANIKTVFLLRVQSGRKRRRGNVNQKKAGLHILLSLSFIRCSLFLLKLLLIFLHHSLSLSFSFKSENSPSPSSSSSYNFYQCQLAVNIFELICILQ